MEGWGRGGNALVLMLAMGMVGINPLVGAHPLEGAKTLEEKPRVARLMSHEHSGWWQANGQPQKSRKEKSFERSLLDDTYIQCRHGQVKGIHGKCSDIHIYKSTKADLFRNLKSLVMKKKKVERIENMINLETKKILSQEKETVEQTHAEQNSLQEVTTSKNNHDKYDLKIIVKHDNKHININTIANTSNTAIEKVNTSKLNHGTEKVAIKDDTRIKDDITISSNDAESDDSEKVKPLSNISTSTNSEKTAQLATELPTTGAEMFTENFEPAMGNLVIKPTNQAARDVTNQGNGEQNEELVTQTEYTVGNSPSTTETIIHHLTGMINDELTTMQPDSYQEGWITDQTTVEPLMDQTADIKQEIASYTSMGEMEANEPTQTLGLETTTQKFLPQTLQTSQPETTLSHSSPTRQSIFSQATMTNLPETTHTFQPHTTIFHLPQTSPTIHLHTTETIPVQNTHFPGTSQNDFNQKLQAILDASQPSVPIEITQTVSPPIIQTVLPQSTQNFWHQTIQSLFPESLQSLWEFKKSSKPIVS